MILQLKGQKSELEELKEKIMKLEQRNCELEKKLTTNNNATGSKDNSLNESFNLNTTAANDSCDPNKPDKVNNNINNSFINTSNCNNTQTNIAAISNTTLLQQNTTNLVFNNMNTNTGTNCSNKGLSQSVSTANNSNNATNSLQHIPNINQGGFIITSNGSIAYVPPMNSTNNMQQQTAKPSSSSCASSSTSLANNLDINTLFNSGNTNLSCMDDQLKIDFESLLTNNNNNNNNNNANLTKNSTNLDLNSLLSKNLFNSFGMSKSNQTSPNQTSSSIASNINVNSTSPNAKTSLVFNSTQPQLPPTAFILSSNGQLLPVISNTPINNLSPVNTSSASAAPGNQYPLILPAPVVVSTKQPQSIFPKPTVAITPKTIKPKLAKTTTTAATVIATTATTTTAKQNKKQSTQAASVESAGIEQQAANVVVPILTSTPLSANPLGAKHRAIRPKPSSNTSHPTSGAKIMSKPAESSTNNLSIGTSNAQSNLLMLPSSLVSPTNKLNYGIIKINTVNASPGKMAAEAGNAALLETNDILAKAASMIFSPSEFTLNNLSPSTTTTTTTTTTTSTNPSTTSPSNGNLVSFQSVIDASSISGAPSGKIAIQRNHSNIQPRKIAIQPLPKTSSQENLSSSDCKSGKPVAQTKSRKLVSKPVESSSQPAANKNANKILLPPLVKSKVASVKPVLAAKPQAKSENSLKSDMAVAVAANLTNDSTFLLSVFNQPQQQQQQQQQQQGNINDMQKMNESLASMCDFEKAFGSLTSNSVLSGQQQSINNNIELVLKQQENMDMQIQLQLQSILNGGAFTSPSETATTKEPVEAAPPKPSIKVDAKLSKKETTSTESTRNDRSKSPEIIESMPSLDDFFGFDANAPTLSLANTDIAEADLKAKKTQKTKATVKSKNTNTKTVSDLNSKPEEAVSDLVRPLKGAEQQIKKKSASSKEEQASKQSNTRPGKQDKSGEKIKFEMGDLDKVLQQVESIASLAKASGQLADTVQQQQDSEFLFDLLNIENSSPTSNELGVKLTTFQTNTPELNHPIDNTVKCTNKQKLKNQKLVLCTPPSIVSSNNSRFADESNNSKVSNKPAGKKILKTNNKTPMKSSTQSNSEANDDEDDFFSFLEKNPEAETVQLKHKVVKTKSSLTRSPLKPDNHQEQILTKKRGRPPKPTSPVKANPVQLVESVDELTNPVNTVNEDKAMLSDAIISQFHELVAEPTHNPEAIQADAEILNKINPNNNKENNNLTEEPQTSAAELLNQDNDQTQEDFANFVYDINTSSSTTATHPANDEQITIASLATCNITKQSQQQRKRGRLNSQLENSSKLFSIETLTRNDEADDMVKRRKKFESIDNAEGELDYNININNNNKVAEDTMDTNVDSEKSPVELTTIAALAASASQSEKRKRGRPAKQSTATATEATSGKPPNYKKINNPCGTTSLLALNTPSNNIEYAGLTRFEIPFELSNANEPVKPFNNECLGSPRSKQPKCDGDDSDEASKLPSSQPTTPNESDTISIEKIQQTSIGNFISSPPHATTSTASSHQLKEKEEILENLYETAATAAANEACDKETNNKSESTNEEDNGNVGDYNQGLTKDLFNTNTYKPSSDYGTKDSYENNNSSGIKASECIQSDSGLGQRLNNQLSNEYWTPNANSNTTNNNKSHVTHYDLENDPIINNDLQQLHKSSNNATTSHFITNITNQSSQSNLIITPPSTVCSASSVSSVASNAFSTGASNLSINPSSTSSTASSTHMISPISSSTDNTASINSMRSSSVDQSYSLNSNQTNYYQQNSYYNSNATPQFNQTYKPSTPNRSFTNNETVSAAAAAAAGFDLSIQQSIVNRNSNSSPQLVNSSQLYRANSATNINLSTQLSTTPTTPPATAANTSQKHLLNTSQSPSHRHSISLSSTPTPTTPTPQQQQQQQHQQQQQTSGYNSYNNLIQNISPPSANAATTSQRSKPVKSSAGMASHSIDNQLYSASNQSYATGNTNGFGQSINNQLSHNHHHQQQQQQQQQQSLNGSNQSKTAAVAAAVAAVSNIYQPHTFTASGVIPGHLPLLNATRSDSYMPGFNTNSSGQNVSNVNGASSNNLQPSTQQLYQQPSHQKLAQYDPIFPTNHYTQQSQPHYHHSQNYLPPLHNPLLSASQALPNLNQSASNYPNEFMAAAMSASTLDAKYAGKPAKANVDLTAKTKSSSTKSSSKKTKAVTAAQPSTASSGSNSAPSVSSLPPQYYGHASSHSNMLHTPNWYDFTSTVNIHQKNSEAAAIASLSNFLQKQQADSVSSYNKLMTNPSDLGGMAAAAAAAAAVSSYSSNTTNWPNQSRHQPNEQHPQRAFASQPTQPQYNTQFHNQTSSLSSLFSSKQSKSSQEELDSTASSRTGTRSNYQQYQQLNSTLIPAANNNPGSYINNMKLTGSNPTEASLASSMPRSASSASLSDAGYQRTHANNSQSGMPSSQESSIRNNLTAQNSYKHQSYQNSQINIAHHHHQQPQQQQQQQQQLLNHNSFPYQNQFLQPSQATSQSVLNAHNSTAINSPLGHHQSTAVASLAAFPHHHHHNQTHHNHQAAAMNSLITNQFSNVSQFNWHPKI